MREWVWTGSRTLTALRPLHPTQPHPGPLFGGPTSCLTSDTLVVGPCHCGTSLPLSPLPPALLSPSPPPSPTPGRVPDGGLPAAAVSSSEDPPAIKEDPPTAQTAALEQPHLPRLRVRDALCAIKDLQRVCVAEP